LKSNGQENKDHIIYIANAGVLIKLADKKILIDALSRSDVPLFRSTPDGAYHQMLNREPPYDGIDFMLITHDHSDHYNQEMVISFLEKTPETFLVASEGIISRIRKQAPGLNSNRFYAMDPALRKSETLTIDGVNIRAMSMQHDGEEFVDVNNMAFLVDAGKKVLHLGDAAPTLENFLPFFLLDDEVDLLLANFPYAGVPKARKIVRGCIGPKEMAVLHLPDPDKDQWGWTRATRRSHDRNKNDFVKTTFFYDSGDMLQF